MMHYERSVIIVRGLFVMAVCVIVATGCSKKVTESPKKDNGYSSFADKSIIVNPSEVPAAEKAKAVQADFNLDGLSDMAYVQKYDSGESEVAILIQKPKGAKDETVVYYRGGGIRRGIEGKITGVASRIGAKYTDLLVLVAYTNKPNEMISYLNDGSGFREVVESEPQTVVQEGMQHIEKEKLPGTASESNSQMKKVNKEKSLK